MWISRRAVVAAAAAAPGLAHAQAGPKPHTIDELLREPVVKDAAISPDGEHLAVLRQEQRDGEPAIFVHISRIRDMDAAPIRIPVGVQQVDQVEWAKNDRLLIWLTLWRDAKGRPYGLAFGDIVIPFPIRRVLSVGLNGGDPAVLFNENRTVLRRSFNAATVVDLLHSDPRRILMQAWDARRNANSLYHVDVYSGHSTPMEAGSSATDGWFTQRGVPMLRMDSNRRGSLVSIYGRAPDEKDWKLVRRVRRNEMDKLPDFDVIGPTADAGVFLVALRRDGENFRTIRTFDLRTLQFGEPVGEPIERDVDGAVIDENLQLVAVASRADRLEYRFTDPQLGANFQAVNRAVKEKVNIQIYDISLDHKRMLLKTTGPQEPGAFMLYDREAKRLHLVAATHPWLEPERLAPVEIHRIKTRDGFEITAYLTRPAAAAAGPLPMVVMPHGGPERRDAYDFDVFPQALAARGWLVLQPNFRGSGGYGRAFAEMGHGRWGDRMQDDVEDAVAVLVAAGRADPKRLAICGASYGGYAALMGAVKRPDLYRCIVSIAGDTDLIEMLKTEREDGADSPTYKYWVAQVGDPKTDLARLQASSPRLRAGEIAAPVLLIHGDQDTIVAPRQSRMMAEALTKAGKPVEHVELPGVPHTDWSAEVWKTVLEKTTSFIAKHI